MKNEKKVSFFFTKNKMKKQWRTKKRTKSNGIMYDNDRDFILKKDAKKKVNF